MKVEDYLSDLSAFGARPIPQKLVGVTNLDLSAEVDYEASIELSNEIGQSFTTARNYFDLKSFSYFSREYSYDEFLIDCKSVTTPLSFSLDREASCFENRNNTNRHSSVSSIAP